MKNDNGKIDKKAKIVIVGAGLAGLSTDGFFQTMDFITSPFLKNSAGLVDFVRV